MSAEKPDLHARVHERFREIFGAPHNAQGQGEQWSLRPFADSISINVMVNGTRDGAAVWIFDPNDRDQSVVNASITTEPQIDELINQIQERMKWAARPRGAARPVA